MNPKAEFYFEKQGKWQEALRLMRTLALECGLNEELKWGCPCYTFEKSNVVLIHEFRDYCAYLFFKGVLLKDAEGILVQQTENVQSARQIRFTTKSQITELAPVLKTYIFEAIEVERAGLKVELKKPSDFTFPDEFQEKIDKNPALKAAFQALSPGRQRAYILYFAAAKQSKTRAARVEKYISNILEGKGLDD